MPGAETVLPTARAQTRATFQTGLSPGLRVPDHRAEVVHLPVEDIASALRYLPVEDISSALRYVWNSKSTQKPCTKFRQIDWLKKSLTQLRRGLATAIHPAISLTKKRHKVFSIKTSSLVHMKVQNGTQFCRLSRQVQ